ncbi:hypothetical protein [Nocardioides astragali]|uniref:Alpha/beta hydrolase n=1 Tax=Nocardioides astragali TaxID=1776736 RepID=A0ABW2N843_9ACTN|nr:hypothetical protein [Nocardioides astragali]
MRTAPNSPAVPSRSDVVVSEVRLPVGTHDGETHVAATVYAPADLAGPATVVCAFPGGGYGRRYYEIDHVDVHGPGQASWHAARGIVFVAFDPYGDGDGTHLPEESRGLRETCAAMHQATTSIKSMLEGGTLWPQSAPVTVDRLVGVGHSLGGMQLVAQQAWHSTFDAVAVLGWSCVQTVVPTADGKDFLSPHHDPSAAALDAAWAGPLVDERSHLRFAYYWDDVSPGLVEEEMGVGFPVRTADPLPAWITPRFPPFAAVCLEPGIVGEEAASITVPVFISAGERDVLKDLGQEVPAYSASRDITMFKVPRCAHMHNLSPQRELLWDRLHRWVVSL